jgi:hypothetical protein
MSWGADRGAGVVCGERSGGASAWAFRADAGLGGGRGLFRTEGSERGWLCLALAGRPLAPGPAIRVVYERRWGGVGLFAADLRLATGPPGPSPAPRETWACLRPICVRLQAHPGRRRHLARRGPVCGRHGSPNRPTPRATLCARDPGRLTPHMHGSGDPDHAGRLVVNYSPPNATDPLERPRRGQTALRSGKAVTTRDRSVAAP